MKYLDDTGLSLLWSKMKGLIPSSLPANGGNADTVDNKHASDFAASDHKHYVGTTAVQSTSANQALSGISKINFVADSTDSSYIGTTVSGNTTTLDFFLSDDREADHFRWLFKYWGDSTTGVVMQLHHTWVASTALKIYDKYVSVEGHTHTFASLTDKPTTLSGYGILDAYTKDEMNTSLAKYVTLNSAQTITGLKTFVSNTYGALMIQRTGSQYVAGIGFRGDSGIYGYLGFNAAGKDGQMTRIKSDGSAWYDVLDSSTTYIQNGKVTINGASITPLPLTGGTLTGKLTVTSNIHVGSSSGNLNNAIKFGTGNAKISYYGNQVIFNTADALRFGHTDWDWDKWAGLSYDATNKIINLGLADGSTFQASNAQSGGTLNLVAVDTLKTSTGKLTVVPSIIFSNGVATDSIEHHTAGGNLCIGDCTNSGLVAIVEDLCGYDDTDANGDGDYETWAITMDGNATFEEVVASQLNVTGTADFKTDVTIETQLFVFDEIKVNGDIISDGAICNGTLQVDEGATLSSTLSVKGATTLSSTLNVTGETTLASTLSVAGATTLSGKLDVSGVTTLKGRLTCSNLTVTKFISTNAMTYGVKILTLLTAADRVRAESTLEVTGATTLSSTLSVNGSANLSGLTCSSLSVTGSASLSSTLKVTGDTTLAANLSVGGSVNTYTITHEEGAEMFIGNDGNTNYVAFVEDLEGYDRDNEESTWQLSTAGNLSNLASVSATNATIGTLTLTSGLKIQASSTKTYTFNMAKAISLGLIS